MEGEITEQVCAAHKDSQFKGPRLALAATAAGFRLREERGPAERSVESPQMPFLHRICTSAQAELERPCLCLSMVQERLELLRQHPKQVKKEW